MALKHHEDKSVAVNQ